MHSAVNQFMMSASKSNVSAGCCLLFEVPSSVLMKVRQLDSKLEEEVQADELPRYLQEAFSGSSRKRVANAYGHSSLGK